MVDEQPQHRSLVRRRRANAEGGRRHFHKVGVTALEEAQLLIRSQALNVTIPRLLVESALAESSGRTVTDRRDAIAELFRLHRVLAAVSNNVNQIARATNSSGEVQADLVAALLAVRRTAARIDAAVDGLSLS